MSPFRCLFMRIFWGITLRTSPNLPRQNNTSMYEKGISFADNTVPPEKKMRSNFLSFLGLPVTPNYTTKQIPFAHIVKNYYTVIISGIVWRKE